MIPLKKHMEKEPEGIELIVPRVDEIPVLPEGMIMERRRCAECGAAVWYEPHPCVAEEDAIIVCSRCRRSVIAHAVEAQRVAPCVGAPGRENETTDWFHLINEEAWASGAVLT